MNRVHTEHQHSLWDKKVTHETVVKSLIGLVAAVIDTGLFWWMILLIFHGPFYFVLPVVYFTGYYIIKGIVKQSYKNPVVLISNLLAGLLGILLGHYFYLLISLK